MRTGLELTEQVVGLGNIVETVSKNVFQKFDSTWRETDGRERCDFPAFCNGMIVAILQMRGSEQVKKNELNMVVISGGPKEPTDLRNESAMLSGLAAPLPFILFDSR